MLPMLAGMALNADRPQLLTPPPRRLVGSPALVLPGDEGFDRTAELAMMPFGALSMRNPQASGPVTDPNFASVVMLCGFNGTNGATAFTDESAAPHALTTNGNAQLSTAQAKFGASSLLLDGTGDFVSAADSADWDVDGKVFTHEAWCYFTSVPSSFTIASQWSSTTTNAAWALFYSGGVLKWRYQTTGGATGNAGNAAYTPPTNTWTHIAATGDGTSARVYVDGVHFGTGSNLSGITPRTSTNPLRIGSTQDFALDFPGFIDEFRITKGVARYTGTGSFTPPSAAFPRS